jgi:hypothetical protein
MACCVTESCQQKIGRMWEGTELNGYESGVYRTVLIYRYEYFIYMDFYVLVATAAVVAFLAYFPKVGLCDLHAVCVPVNSPPPPINFWMPEPIFIKPGMYIMPPEPI